MCASTRFPEAIPLRNIKAKTIVTALTKFFALVGLPSSIQSDQGSNFMSEVFRQVMYELGITQCKSSAYHLQSQGALERWHQTLKTMMRIPCFERERETGMRASICYCLPHESRCRSPWDSVPLSFCLDTL